VVEEQSHNRKKDYAVWSHEWWRVIHGATPKGGNPLPPLHDFQTKFFVVEKRWGGDIAPINHTCRRRELAPPHKLKSKEEE